MTALLERLLSIPAVWVYVVVTALVFVEDALFVGFLVPAETAVVLGGVAAQQGRLDVWALAALVVVAAVAGDSVGYEVGRHLGPRLLRGRLATRHQAGIDSASAALARRGGPAVLLARLTAFLRAVTPALAGVARMPYRTFLAWNALGGLFWGVGAVLIGYLAGASWQRVVGSAGRVGAAVVVLVAVIGWVVWRVRRHGWVRASGDRGSAERADTRRVRLSGPGRAPTTSAAPSSVPACPSRSPRS